MTRIGGAIWRAAHVTSLAARDAVELLANLRKPMTPSHLQNRKIGGHDFHEVGRELAAIVISLGGLMPHERVLDIGCGYGRVAVPLTRYLTSGEYSGFDIDRRAIKWCRREISSRHSNFWFAFVDVANNYYNRRGTHRPDEFTFPCADSSVDVVVATSLFTHLLPAAASRYVSEIARVLKPGGRAVVSFFLFDDEVKALMQEGRVYPSFPHFPEPFYAVTDAKQPELGIAYDQSVVVEAFRAQGLPLVTVAPGYWSGRATTNSFQDFVITDKPAPPLR